MFKKSIRLRAEPRLWGAVALDHPRNPPEWRGKGFAMGSLLGLSTTAVATVSDGAGNSLKVDARPIALTWANTRSGTLFASAKRRWLRRRFDNGTLDISCGDRTARRDELGVAIFCGVLLCAAAAMVAWKFIGGVAGMPASQRTWVDWLVAIGGCGVMLFMPVLLLSLLLKGLRRTCWVYRLTADHLTPMDGPLAGTSHTLREAIDYGNCGLNLLRVRFAERTLLISRPPLPAALLLRKEEEEKRRNKSQIRRITGILIAGVVLASVVGILTQPITGMPAWRPGLVLVAMVPAALLNMFGQRWMSGWISRRERRSKQRQNRYRAATGQPR